MRAWTLLTTLPFALLATPAAAQLRPLVEPPASARAAQDGVVVFLLNEGSTPLSADGPAEIETVARDGTRLRLIAAPDGPLTVAPGGFARVHYRLAAAAPAQPDSATPAPVTLAAAPAAPAREITTRTSAGTADTFADRLQPFEPVYGAIGTGDSGTKLQLSFAFRLFGEADRTNFNFAYTQTMFWATNLDSGPFRTTTYSPELFFDVPLGTKTTAAIGYRHDSNGEGGRRSIDVNRVYARVTRSFDLGGDWRAEVTPQAWFYFAAQGAAPDIERYWGYTSLSASIGQRDGLKLAFTARGNPDSGRGGAEAFLSYPLVSIDDRLPHLYLFGQAFTGYGEALSDYNRRVTYARLGVAFTR